MSVVRKVLPAVALSVMSAKAPCEELRQMSVPPTLNVVMPMEVPKEIEIGGFSTKDFDINNFDLPDYGKLFLDDIPIDVSKKDFDITKLKDHFTFYLKKERFTIDDLLSGKLAGKIVALGDTINILIKIDEDSLEKFSEGHHNFKFKSEIIPILEFNFE